MDLGDPARAVQRVPDRPALLGVDRVGYLVPACDFDGIVHSVFASTCNIACEGTLLTLAVPANADGPTTLVLDGTAPRDLRALFRAGEQISRRGGVVGTARVTLDIRAATSWHPDRSRPRLRDVAIVRNLRVTEMLLHRHRRSIPRARDPAGTLWRSGLERACRELDAARAGTLAMRVIGLGEGLTPAGDDFLVGLCAGLDACQGEDTGRQRLRRRLGAVLNSQSRRTTPISAHFLRLAAGGHFSAQLVRARLTLLAESAPSRVRAALDDLLAVGATSGIATCAGLHSGLSVWSATGKRSQGARRR